MSHDPEAVEAIDQWLAMPQRPDRDTATDLLDYLAAAGYTVTKARYEQICGRSGLLLWTDPAGGVWHFAQEDADYWRRAMALEPLYRKIEGSTDGCSLGDECDDTLCTDHGEDQ